MPKTFLFCEDDPGIRDSFTNVLRRRFHEPEYKIIPTSTLDEALCLADREIFEGNLVLVQTDGDLGPRSAGDGFQLAQRLRGIGYTGPIIYDGSTKIPAECQSLFSDTPMKKKDIPQMVDLVRKYLKPE